MKLTALSAAAVSMVSAVALAQPAPSRSTPSQAPPAATAPVPAVPSSQDTAAASGNSNQTVATTNANAPTPARGANSFTEGEARSKIEFERLFECLRTDQGRQRRLARQRPEGQPAGSGMARLQRQRRSTVIA